MKKITKAQMYSKMYLITPMVYEKVKNHLDKSDKMALTNINKPYFTPKIEFHGQPNNPGYNYPPYPPMPPQIIIPPTMPTYQTNIPHIPDEPFNPYIPQEEMRSTTDMGTQPEENPSEMEWLEYENLPPQTSEMQTQTDLTIDPSDVPVDYEHQGTQTEGQMPSVHQETQTNIPTSEQGTQANIPMFIPTSEQGTQTDMKKKIIMPTFSASTQTDEERRQPQPSYMTSSTQTEERRQPQPSYTTSSTQTPLEISVKTKRKRVSKQERVKIPKRGRGPSQIQEIPMELPAQVQPVIPQQVIPQQVENIQVASRALVPYTGDQRRQQNREPGVIRSRTVSISRRQPSRISLQRNVREAIARDLHAQHFGQQVTPQYRLVQNQRRALTYQSEPNLQRAITYQPEMSQQQRRAITYQQDIRTEPEHQIAIPETRAVAIPEPESLYTVEYPADEPPGMRSTQQSASSIPAEIYVHTPYKRKRKRKQTISTPGQTTTTGLSSDTQNIDLQPKKSKKTFQCDTCNAVLSSQYNLTRHKIREARRFEELGKIPDELPDDQIPQFSTWEQFPKKRTSTDARFIPRQHRKRVMMVKTKQPSAKKQQQTSESTYTQWK